MNTTNTAPHTRPRCSVFIALSVDGYIARPDGSIDWLGVVRGDNDDYGYQEFSDSVDTLIVGRNTYDLALGFDTWPYSGKRCVVLTHRAATPRHGEEFYSGDAATLVEDLGRAGMRHAYVDGGTVIQQFLAADLIDDLTLSIVPILLGSGITLFAQGGPGQQLTLTRTRSWPSGLVQIRYAANDER